MIVISTMMSLAQVRHGVGIKIYYRTYPSTCPLQNAPTLRWGIGRSICIVFFHKISKKNEDGSRNEREYNGDRHRGLDPPRFLHP